MAASLKRFPEFNLQLSVFSGAVTDDDLLKCFSALDHKAHWLGVFTKDADVSGVDIACFPALKRAVTPDASEPAGTKPRLSALVNLSESSELFVRFWAHYATAGDRSARKREVFSTIEAARQWLGLPAAAAGKIVAAVTEAKIGPAEVQAAAESRRKLLKAASRIFRQRGFEGMTLPEILAATGLPLPALGELAESKDDLIVHALLDAMGDVTPIEGDMADFAAGYLSAAQRANVAEGCAMAALASETLRQSPATRAALTTGLTWHVERLSRVAPGEDAAAQHRASVRAWAAMVGALILARVSDDEVLSQEFLDETRAWIADPAIAAVRAARSASPQTRPQTQTQTRPETQPLHIG
jgi:TetR/AcrR family transcriptional repressor of nem operon